MSTPNDLSATHSDEDLEKKKWIINVLDSRVQDGQDELNSAKQEWVIKFREAYPINLTTSRNRILATIAFVVGVLFSLNDFLNIGSLKYIFLSIIIGLLLYGLIVYILSSRAVKKVTTAVNDIELGYYLPQTRLIMLKGYMSELFLSPEKLTVANLEDLGKFVYFVGLNRVELVDAFKDANKDPIFNKDKQNLELITQSLEEAMTFACIQYEKKFSKSNALVGNLLFLVESMVNKYGSTTKSATT